MLITVTTGGYLNAIFPYPATAQSFFVLSTLGKNEIADNYYPNNDSSVNILQEVEWHIQIQNLIGSVQFVQIRVKVQNSTMPLPDSSNLTPSPEPSSLNFTVFLRKEQSVILPFHWYVSERVLSSSSTTLEEIIINGMPIDLNVQTVNGGKFYFVFELWHYDVASGSFIFHWDSNFGFQCAWNSLIFEVN